MSWMIPRRDVQSMGYNYRSFPKACTTETLPKAAGSSLHLRWLAKLGIIGPTMGWCAVCGSTGGRGDDSVLMLKLASGGFIFRHETSVVP